MNRMLTRKRAQDEKAAKATAATKPRGSTEKRRRTSPKLPASAPSASSSVSTQKDPAPPATNSEQQKPRERASRPSQRLLKSEIPQILKKKRMKPAVEPMEETQKSKRVSALAPALSLSKPAKPTPAPTPIKTPPIAPKPPTENEEESEDDDDEGPLDACSSPHDKLYPIGDATQAEIDDYCEKIEKGHYEHPRKIFLIANEKKKGALIEVMKNHRNIWDRRRFVLNRTIHPQVNCEWVNIALEVEKKTGHLYHVITLKKWWNSLCGEYKKHIKKGETFAYFEQLSFMKEAADFELARDVNYEAVRATLIEKQKNAQSLQESAEPSVADDDDIGSAAPSNFRKRSQLSSCSMELETVSAPPVLTTSTSVYPETQYNGKDDGGQPEMHFYDDGDDDEVVVDDDNDDQKPDIGALRQDFHIAGDGLSSGEDYDSRPSVISFLVDEQKPNIGKNNVTVVVKQEPVDQMYKDNGQREISPTISLATSEESVFAFDAAGQSSSAAPSVPSSIHHKKNTSVVTTSRSTVEIDGETIQVPPLPNQGSFESQTETRKGTIVDSEFIFTSALTALMAVENDETAYNKMKIDLFRVVLNAVND